MRNTLVAFLCGALFAVALMFSSKVVSAAPPESHPEIQAALNHLEQAKGNLERGEHDFGGHREKALNHTNQAISECQEALRYRK